MALDSPIFTVSNLAPHTPVIDKAFCSVAVLLLALCVSHLIPRAIAYYVKKRRLPASEQLFIKILTKGMCAALFLAVLSDVVVFLMDGNSYVSQLGYYPEKKVETVFTALRDGLVGNFLFFLATGVFAAKATWFKPEGELLRQRLQMLFPRLVDYQRLVDPVVERALELAAPSECIELTISIDEYDPGLDAYKIHVIRKETFVNLLLQEEYKAKRFSVSVAADLLNIADGAQLGVVEKARFIAISAGPVVEVKKSDYLDSEPKRSVALTTSCPEWKLPETPISIPPGGKGVWMLRYWYWAKRVTPYESACKRPVDRYVLTIHNRLADLEVGCEVIADGVERAPVRKNAQLPYLPFWNAPDAGSQRIKARDWARWEWFPQESLPSLKITFEKPDGLVGAAPMRAEMMTLVPASQSPGHVAAAETQEPHDLPDVAEVPAANEDLNGERGESHPLPAHVAVSSIGATTTGASVPSVTDEDTALAPTSDGSKE